MGGAPYVLEVSCPGVDRPLTERRHWLRSRKRLVAVILGDGGTVEGRLTAVDDDGLVVDGRRLPWRTWCAGGSRWSHLRGGRDLGDDDAVDERTDDETDDDETDDDGTGEA